MFCFGKTDIGMKRNVNQDCFKCTEFNSTTVLAVVCDGMGGAAGGEIAGNLAAQTFTDFVSSRKKDLLRKKTLTRADENKIKNILKSAVAAANKAVYERTENDMTLRGMGTTLVATLLCCGTLFTINVGDSRMYLITEGTIRQISHDHSYVQFLIDTGRLTPEDAKKSNNRNIITRAVGTEESVEADIYVNKAPKKGYVLLCSDGLVNFVPPEEMYNTVNDIGDNITEEAIDECLDTLILAANTAGGSDNITVVLMSL